MTANVAPGRLWFALAAAPAAWVVQGLLGWWFGARICNGMSIGTVRIAVGVLGVAALIVAVGGLLVGMTNWRAVASEVRPAADRIEFMSLGGVLVSSAFAVGIAWATLNAVFIGVCGGMR